MDDRQSGKQVEKLRRRLRDSERRCRQLEEEIERLRQQLEDVSAHRDDLLRSTGEGL